jgi:hypothetical protein
MVEGPLGGGAGDDEHPLPREALGDRVVVGVDRRFVHTRH